MKYLSLFSGIGGFELGIQQAYEEKAKGSGMARKRECNSSSQGRQKEVDLCGAGVSQNNGNLHNGLCRQTTKNNLQCIGYSEIDKYAIQIYEKHFNHKNYGDITKIDPSTLPDFDLIVGGFPCQSFSIAGKRRGFSDTRGTLFFDIARILKAKKPKKLLLENVKGLLSHDHGQTFKTIIATLDELGYDCQWQVLNSKNFGVPQNRERVFIVGHLRGTSRPEVFSIGEDDKVSDSEDGTDKRRTQATTVRPDIGTKADGTYIKEGINCLTIRATQHKSGDNQTAIVEKGMKIRRLTPTECERLQGFPDGWTKLGVIEATNLSYEGNRVQKEVEISDTQRYKTLGNAVTVNVIKAIMSKI